MRRDKGIGRRPAGFTLIELLVVLAIVSLGIAVVLPLLGKGQSGATLAGAASEVQSALRAARSAAIEHSRPVIFRGGEGGFWIDAHRYRLGAGAVRAGIRVAVRGGSRISFFPSGGSSGGRVLLQSVSARREIRVEAITGRAEFIR